MEWKFDKIVDRILSETSLAGGEGSVFGTVQPGQGLTSKEFADDGRMAHVLGAYTRQRDLMGKEKKKKRKKKRREQQGKR